jgi:hypothetical protein
MTISGLLTVKPANTPKVGDVRCYTVENRVAQSGNSWNKIKGSTPDNGGQSYKVISVTPTGRTDKYGNISLNIEVEPANGAQTAPHPQIKMYAGNGDDRSSRIERQHSQEMALRYFVMKVEVEGTVFPAPTTDKLREMINWFQRDISHTPSSPVTQQPEPQSQSEPDDDEEIPF